MAGDTYSVRVASGWQSSVAPINTPSTIATDLLNLITNGISTNGGKATPTQLQSTSTGISNGIGTLLAGQTVASNTPKAYLNWILFNDQFKYVASGSDPVSTSSSTMKTHLLTNLPVNKNGYLYIYCSNDLEQSVKHKYKK